MKHLLCIFLISLTSTSLASSVQEDLEIIKSYFNSDLDSAIILASDLLKKSEAQNSNFGIVKSNLYLGYLVKKQKYYGKSVIYNLEGIRHSEIADYEGIVLDRIWLRRNLANTFRQFEANELATKYNLEAIDIAIKYNVTNQIIILKLNQGLVYQNNEQFDEAAQILKEILPLVTNDKVRESEVINQIGLIYLESGDFEKASYYFNQLVASQEEGIELHKARALHNLGEIEYENGNLPKAITFLEEAINILESSQEINFYSLFISKRNIGRYLFEVGELDESERILKEAEEIASHAEFDPSSFEVYKTLSNLYFNSDRPEKGNHYSEVYFRKVQEFIETQEEVQRRDKEYNFELITKRYFDEVEKQDRIASILLISKLSSGSLVILLILVIAYYQTAKIRLRRDIEKELKLLNIFD